MFAALIIGVLFGFIGSMPVAGPIAVLVFARAIEGRYRSGLYIAFGCGLAESAYACLAFWGFSTLLADHEWVVPVSRGVAAVILFGLGLVFARRGTGGSMPAVTEQERPAEGRWGSFALGLSITALNPTLIATWSAAATTLFSTGLVSFEPHLAAPFGVGALSGIIGWFALLLGLVRRYKGRFSTETLDRVIRVMGIFLIALGLWFAWVFVDGLLAAR